MATAMRGEDFLRNSPNEFSTLQRHSCRLVIVIVLSSLTGGCIPFMIWCVATAPRYMEPIALPEPVVRKGTFLGMTATGLRVEESYGGCNAAVAIIESEGSNERIARERIGRINVNLSFEQKGMSREELYAFAVDLVKAKCEPISIVLYITPPLPYNPKSRILLIRNDSGKWVPRGTEVVCAP